MALVEAGVLAAWERLPAPRSTTVRSSSTSTMPVGLDRASNQDPESKQESGEEPKQLEQGHCKIAEELSSTDEIEQRKSTNAEAQ